MRVIFLSIVHCALQVVCDAMLASVREPKDRGAASVDGPFVFELAYANLRTFTLQTGVYVCVCVRACVQKGMIE